MAMRRMMLMLMTQPIMTGLLMTGLLVTGVLQVTTQMTHAAPGDGARSVDPEIAKVAEAFRTAMLKGDAAAVAAVYREDAVEMPSCAPPVYGRAAIERYYREMFTHLGTFTSFTLSHLEATVSGDIAFLAGTSRQTIAVPAKGAFDDSGKYVVVLKRTGGAWKVAYSMAGGDHQLLPPPSTSTSTAQH
jgi:uncharacterized protein (TIGR02246 family)